MTATGYAPLNTLKPVADGIWVIDGPAIWRACVPMPTRAVVVQLDSGALWVYSPTELTDGLRAELDALGPVRHIIQPNADHTAHVEAWQAAFPEAKLWAPEGVSQTAKRLKADAAQTPWTGQLEQRVVRSGPDRREAVFCHIPSRSLIFADLYERLETQTLPPLSRPIVWLSGTDDSGGHMRPTHRWALRDKHKNALAEDVEVLIKWGPRRILLSHGKIVSHSATDELERAFRKCLRPYRWEVAYRAQRDVAEDKDSKT